MRALSRVIYAGCLLAPWSLLWLDGSTLFPFETGKAWVFRSVVEFSFGLSLLLFLAQKQGQPRETARWFSWPILALLFLVWTLMSNLAGIDAYRSFWSNYERMAGYIAYLHWAMYFVCLKVVLDRQRSKLFLINLILIISAVCFIGLFDDETRIISTLGNPIYLGNAAVLGLFMLGFTWARYRPAGRIQVIFSVVISIAVAGLFLYALFLSASRGAVLALLVGVSFMLLSLFWQAGRSPKRFIIGALLLFFASTLLFTQAGQVQTALKQSDHYVLQRLGKISLKDQTTVDRFENWQIALQAARQRPLMGWGQENYAIAFTEHYQSGVIDKAKIWFDRAHNAYLDVLIASGVLGLLLYGVMLCWPLVWLFKNPIFSSLETAFAVGFFAAFMAKNIVGFDTFSSSLLWLGFWVVILVSSERNTPNLSLSKSSNRLIFNVLILILSLFSIYHLNFKFYAENRLYARVMAHPQALASHDLNTLLQAPSTRFGQNAKLAVMSKVLRQKLPKDQGLAQQQRAEVQQGALFTAVGELVSIELARQPRNYRVQYNAAVLLTQLGHHGLAQKLFESLTLAAPQRTIFWQSLIRLYQATGQAEKAEAARKQQP